MHDLEESAAFYADVLGCDVGRTTDDFVDVWFFGMQLTLHAAPEQHPLPTVGRGVDGS